MSGHTKGPWFADKCVEGTIGGIQDSHGEHVAQAQARQPLAAGKPDYERKANARLIAAAPELLEALEGMTERYTELANSGDCGFWDCENENEVKAARAAIKKAKGE